ncbi:hypothetical protein M0804_009792 [Polistes exclamans]|nr:hypothetical protein M0804_009792 [Polistes exclamans]
MADNRFTTVLRLLWKNHQRGISVENSATEFLSKDYFVYPDVCLAVINYWFRFFNEHPTIEYPETFVTYEERLAFLFVLLRDNSTWTTLYYMDALKVSRGTIYNYMARLDFYHCQQGWIRYEELKK